MADSEPEVVIIGAGLAGLSCAVELQQRGISFQLIEKSDQVGGRVRSDHVDGFILDRGFQVFLTAYPEAKRVLDYDSLQLRRFQPGAIVRYRGKFHRFSDPWRDPGHALQTAFSPLATLGDKLRVASLKRRVVAMNSGESRQASETTTLDFLLGLGFSSRIMTSFFRPFLGGVFLESDLATSSEFFEFVFAMFSLGDAALPAAGMAAIPQQLAERLEPHSIRLNEEVNSIDSGTVTLSSGEQLRPRLVVLATERDVAEQLLKQDSETNWNGVTCLYYAADQAPLSDPILVLNGEGKGPINNLCVPTNVAPSYSRDGRALISVSVIDPFDGMEAAVKSQLLDWYGSNTNSWEHLATYNLSRSLPSQTVDSRKLRSAADDIILCGDHCETSSIQGGMLSGRKAAESVVQRLG